MKQRILLITTVHVAEKKPNGRSPMLLLKMESEDIWNIYFIVRVNVDQKLRNTIGERFNERKLLRSIKCIKKSIVCKEIGEG